MLTCVNCGRELESLDVVIVAPNEEGCSKTYPMCIECYDKLIKDILERKSE